MHRLVTLTLTLALAAASPLLSGCTDCRVQWPKTPQQQQYPGSMLLTLQTPRQKSGHQQCLQSTKATIRWGGRLEGAGSGTGQTTFTVQKEHEAKPDLEHCNYTFTEVVPNLQPGAWVVSATYAESVLTCRATVTASAQTRVEFIMADGGCSQGTK